MHLMKITLIYIIHYINLYFIISIFFFHYTHYYSFHEFLQLQILSAVLEVHEDWVLGAGCSLGILHSMTS